MKQHAYWVSALLIMSACQGQMPTVVAEQPAAQTASLIALSAPMQSKPEVQGQATLTGTQIRVRLQLPPAPPFLGSGPVYE
jgi:hypothetical protein